MNMHKVLVVDDELDIQKVIRMSLRMRGVEEVEFAGDGEECLAVVKDVKPDLILLDVSMPKLGGYETCRFLKANPETRSIPVIFLTAKVQRGDEETGLRAGAAGYLRKPFDPLTLHDDILAILEKEGAPRSP
jgi:two-component system, OmpR family, alkaline phosphatase synthesis response regulator PhoP